MTENKASLMYRNYNVWAVRLQDDAGTMSTINYRALWDPKKVSEDEVALACAAETTYTNRRKHVAISATLVDDPMALATAQSEARDLRRLK